MLITPRTYQQIEAQRKGAKLANYAWDVSARDVEHASNMLLVHQVGSLKIGEVARYTLTYTPSYDRILPAPSHLHVKIRNTSAIPLRAAYLVGPYTLYASCYPSTFDPNHKNEDADQHGSPEFEPNLKAGGTWTGRLTVPESVRESAGKANPRRSLEGSPPSFTWIIDISSQVIFSISAAVHFELLVGRDEKSVDIGFAGMGSKSGATPGKLEEHQFRVKGGQGKHNGAQPKGVFSPAVKLQLDDTDSLWQKPPFPTWDTQNPIPDQRRLSSSHGRGGQPVSFDEQERLASPTESVIKMEKPRKKKKVHLVVLTHGLHSNLGADMLYLKESIDAAAKQARTDARQRKRAEKATQQQLSTLGKEALKPSGEDSKVKAQESLQKTSESADSNAFDGIEDEDSDEEEVLVRGYSHNACRTERGIQYLGKRLAKWILSVTYPDQEYLPQQKKSVRRKISRAFTGDQQSEIATGTPQHSHSSIYHPSKKPEEKAYKITSISFIAHSLGGLTQTYAIAYIHKHSPNFFDEIKPINFVAMAAPFLGLSNENPLYVRFALDFGLVGRTGQDLGLSWRAPAMVRSGWEAMIGGIGNEGQRAQKQQDPGSKPLLRILPTGHTHQVLKKFRNRTVYSNVVNDGIVPLRTSCLLFLDWSGLGRVEKARRENGLIGTTLGWGWAELTGANSSSRAHLRAERDSEAWSMSDISAEGSPSRSQPREARAEVPQPGADALTEDNTSPEKRSTRSRSVDTRGEVAEDGENEALKRRRSSIQHTLTSPISGLLSLLRPGSQKSNQSPKHERIYRRGQIVKTDSDELVSPIAGSPAISRSPSPARPGLVRGNSVMDDSNNMFAPPKTTIFESAGDVLNPPLPTNEFIINPNSRPRTIFHDRVYHPEDIPPPPAKKSTRMRSSSGDSKTGLAKPAAANGEQKGQTQDIGAMKVEEKIARAYHHGLSWRKVLVRLEPDAHNNMVVRRMFANAYGWPVVKHIVDTHFADTLEANTADVLESNEERAQPIEDETNASNEDEPQTGNPKTRIQRTDSEMREAVDSISDLRSPKGADSKSSSYSSKMPILSREDSAQWDDTLFDITDDSDEDGVTHDSHPRKPQISLSVEPESPKGTSEAEIAEFLTRSPLPSESPLASSKDQRVTGPAGGTSAIGLGKSLEDKLDLGKSGKSSAEDANTEGGSQDAAKSNKA